MSRPWAEVRRPMTPERREAVRRLTSRLEAWEALHRIRHRPPLDDRDHLLSRWSELLALRAHYGGELSPSAWSTAMARIIDAIASDRRVWPVYARSKGQRPPEPEITVVVTPVPPAAALGPWRTSPLKLAMDQAYQEIADRVDAGELEATAERMAMLKDWRSRQ